MKTRPRDFATSASVSGAEQQIINDILNTTPLRPHLSTRAKGVMRRSERLDQRDRATSHWTKTRRLLMRFVCSEIHEKLVFLMRLSVLRTRRQSNKKPRPLVESEDKQNGQRVALTSAYVCVWVEEAEKYWSRDLYRVVLYILCSEQAVKIENYFCSESPGEETGETQALPHLKAEAIIAAQWKLQSSIFIDSTSRAWLKTKNERKRCADTDLRAIDALDESACGLWRSLNLEAGTCAPAALWLLWKFGKCFSSHFYFYCCRCYIQDIMFKEQKTTQKCCK